MSETEFARACKREVVCDICGSRMHAVPGGGWDNDRMYCADVDCGAEIVYPTSTHIEELN